MKSSAFLLICGILAITNHAQVRETRGLENKMNGNFKSGLEIFQFLTNNGKDFLEMASWFSTKNAALPSAFDHILDSYFVFPKNISTICERHVRYAIKTFLTKLKETSNPANEWSMQMFDSLPKPPSGLINGNIFWLGNFWECIGVDTGKQEAYQSQSMQGENTSSADNYFRGEYCIVSLNVNMPVELRLGLCLPDSCTFEDKSHLVAHWLRTTQLEGKLDKTFCQTAKRQDMDNTAKLITGCLLGIIFLVIIGTFADCMQHKGKLENAFTVLSLPRNLKKIFDMEKKDGEIQVLHGIRFFTLSWIVLGHCYESQQMAPIENMMDMKRTIEDDIWFGAMLNMPFSVDTFFMIGSMLVTYTFLNKMQTSESCNFHIMYLSRYIRITPALMTTVAMVAGPFYYLGSGPVWPFIAQFKSSCRESWWAFMTYVFNLLPSKPQCNDPAWYLAVDMQMFLVTPLILFPLYKKPKWGLAGIIICFGLTVLFQMLVVHLKNVEFLITSDYNVQKLNHYFKHFYMTPWGHFGQYLVGIFLGYTLHVHFRRNEIFIRPVTTAIGWILSVIIPAGVVFGTYPIASGQLVATPMFNVLYGPLSRQAWTISIAWIIFACAIGNGGAIDSILSWRYFTPLSRISYASYLIHQMVLIAYFASTSQSIHYDHYRMAYVYVSSMIATLILGLLFCVLFEMPLISLLNILLLGDSKKKAKPENGDRELLLKQDDL